MVENTGVDPTFSDQGEAVPEHYLALLYGLSALVLGAAVWSAMAVLFGPWSLLAAPGLGWLIGWASRHGGRRADTSVRTMAWLLSLAGTLGALFLQCAFSVTQTSPDAGFQIRVVGAEYGRLFTEPPWFGSFTICFALGGTWRALRDRPRRRPGPRPALSDLSERVPATRGAAVRAETTLRPRASAARGSDSRAA